MECNIYHKGSFQVNNIQESVQLLEQVHNSGDVSEINDEKTRLRYIATGCWIYLTSD